MRRYFNFLAGVLALCCLGLAPLKAQTYDPVIEKVIEIGKTDNRTMEHLDVLSNRFGGRLVGSDTIPFLTQFTLRQTNRGTVRDYGCLP